MHLVRSILRMSGRLGALLALLVLLGGVPTGLWRIVGWPLPRRLPTDRSGWEHILTSRFPDQAVINLLAIALWIVWAAFAYSVWVEWRAARGGRHHHLPRVLGPMQALAALLVTAIASGPVALAATPAVPPPAVIQVHPNPVRTIADVADPHGRWSIAPISTQRVTGRPAGDSPTTGRVITDQAVAAGRAVPGSMRAGDPAVRVSPAQPPRFAVAGFDGPLQVRVGDQHYTYTVHAHDTLWDIAGVWLGDHTRWPEIYQLNAGRYDQHGRMHHGDHIEPGWVLVLPDDARPPADAQPVPPHTAPPPATGTSPAPSAPSSSRPAPAPSATTPPSPSPTSDPTDDGVDPGSHPNSAPPSTASNGTASPSPASVGPAAGPAGQHDHHDHGGAGIDLPDGGWVAAPVAAAVAAAAALVWIQRRRRYRPRPPGPDDRDDSDLVPLPGTVAALHAAAQQQSRHAPTIEYDAKDEPVDDLQHLSPEAREAATVIPASFGVYANRPLRLPDLPALGVGLTGPGAPDAARGVLAAALSAGGPWAPGDEATIITTAADLAGLLGPDAADRYPLDRLHVADTTDDALTHLQHQLLRRARLATDRDSADLTTLHPDHTDQPPAPIVFLTTAPHDPLATALAAVLAVGSRLGIAGLLLGPWPTGATWHVNTDGSTQPDGESATAGPRLNVLDAAAAADILATLVQARPATNDLPPAPSTPTPQSPPLTQAGPVLRRVTTPPVPGATHPPADHDPANSDRAVPAPGITAPGPADADRPSTKQDPSPTGSSGPRLALSVLGKPAVQVRTRDTASPVRIRRSDGTQILVHLAVQPDGATSDQLMAVLWPETRPHLSRRRFHTTMSELRQTLVDVVGAEAITRTDERYRLDPAYVDADIWQLTAAAHHAATTVDPAEHATALHEVIKLYTGTIADGHHWLWLAPYRETIRRHVMDAYVGLADTEPNPATALALIQEAIRIDPYNEDVYQRAMRLHAALNSADGITRTLRTLTERLADLEVDVSPQTQELATDLLAKLEARRRKHGNAA